MINTVNMLKPKGTLGVPDIREIEDLEKQIAIAQTPQAQTPSAEDKLRERTVASVLAKLENPVATPRYLTIQDIFNKNADLNGVLGTFNPGVARGLNSLFGTKSFNPKTGEIEDLGEAEPRRQEAVMQAEQQKALEREKMQDSLAAHIYGDFITQDIENMRDKRARELAEQELAFRREENAKDRAMRMGLASLIHGGGGGGRSGGGGSTGGAAGVGGAIVGGVDLSKVKMTAAERKALTENKTTIANIDAGLKSLEKNKDAYTFWKGVVGSDIANRIDPKGIGTRTQIDNITAVYRKWLTGAQMSDKERKAYERFLPAPTDNYNIVKAKLKGMRGAVQRSNDAILSNYGIGGNSDPLGLGL